MIPRLSMLVLGIVTLDAADRRDWFVLAMAAILAIAFMFWQDDEGVGR